MNVTVKQLPKSQVELIIEITSEELKPYLDQAVSAIAKDAKISGFRPGKVPFDVLAKQVGDMHIYQQAAEKAVTKTFPKALAEQQLITVGQPQISIEKIAPHNPLIYKAIVALLPKVKLGNYKGIREKKKAISIEQEEIDHTIGNIRKMFGKEKRVQRGIQKTDKVEIDMDTYVDKVPIDGGTSKNHKIVVGEGHFIPGFEEALLDMIEGQSSEIKLTFPKEYHRKDLAGRPVIFKVKVNSVNEVELPPVDDNFAKMVGRFEKLDELHKQIEENLKQEKNSKEHQRWELAVIDKIISQSTYDEIPDILVDSELDKMLHELESEVTDQGMKFEDYLTSIKKSKDDLKKEFRGRAEKRVKTAIALRQIAKVESIVVNDRELVAEIEKEKTRHQSNPEIIQQIKTEEYRNYLKTVMRSRKVFEFLSKNN